jgi:hypothetical protein
MQQAGDYFWRQRGVVVKFLERAVAMAPPTVGLTVSQPGVIAGVRS